MEMCVYKYGTGAAETGQHRLDPALHAELKALLLLCSDGAHCLRPSQQGAPDSRSQAEKADGGEITQRPHQHQHRAAEIPAGSRVSPAAARLEAGEGRHLGDGRVVPEELAAAAAPDLRPHDGQGRLLPLRPGGRRLPVPQRGPDSGSPAAPRPLPGPAGVRQERSRPRQPLSTRLSPPSGQLQQGAGPDRRLSVETLVKPPNRERERDHYVCERHGQKSKRLPWSLTSFNLGHKFNCVVKLCWCSHGRTENSRVVLNIHTMCVRSFKRLTL